MPGESRIASTTSRPPLTRFATPAGSSSSARISKTIDCVIGVCSEGLRMNVLPAAIANGRNHIGTIAGKLNGVIAAHTPTGWRIVSQSTLVATDLERAPLHRLRHRAVPPRPSRSRARPRRARRDRLAHLARHRLRELPGALLERLVQAEHEAGAADDRRRSPRRERRTRGGGGRLDLVAAAERDLRQHFARRGIGDVQARARAPTPSSARRRSSPGRAPLRGRRKLRLWTCAQLVGGGGRRRSRAAKHSLRAAPPDRRTAAARRPQSPPLKDP